MKTGASLGSLDWGLCLIATQPRVYLRDDKGVRDYDQRTAATLHPANRVSISSRGPQPQPSPHTGDAVGFHSKARHDRPRNHHGKRVLRS
jgi:hypothetical protein